MRHQFTQDQTAFNRGAKAARKGLSIIANPYRSSRDYHAKDWWRGWRSVTGVAELAPIVIPGFDDRADILVDGDEASLFSVPFEEAA